MGDKPKDLEEYIYWMQQKHNVRKLPEYRLYFEQVRDSIIFQLNESNLWKTLVNNLREYHDEFLLSKKYELLISRDFKPEIVGKEYSSFLEKTFRKNVIENKNWPDEPKDGWFLPDNWLLRINDIVRSKIIVNYLEGMEFLCERIGSYCKVNQVKFHPISEARIDGYYAINSYFNDLPFLIIDKYSGNQIEINISIELQITTQIQELMRNLLHKQYEKTRLSSKKDNKWQWDYKDDKFSTAYIAHLLHYAEGMLMAIMEKNKTEEKL